ncbi:MAG: phosphotransferase [Flavobacteriales bacterium]|nr:phosphotransferase [Flavobacteriales bacterium]
MASYFKADFLLEVNDISGLGTYLSERGRLAEGEKLTHIGLAGEGNMNVVLRVFTDQRSFILKQSRPWVNKYPSVAAPSDRILTEYHFYEVVRKNEVIREYTPEIFWFDEKNFILCMEDFGPSNDFTSIYRKDTDLQKSEMADIARVVSELHFNFKDLQESERITNRKLRVLNHQHIFELPLQAKNGFDLDGVVLGLQSATAKFRNDEKLKKYAAELGGIYLADDGTRLLHGDYYPGSWLKTDNGFRMIDPEFCFTGPAEFELGVCVAHLKMAQQSDSLIKDLFVYYHFDSRFDGSLFSKFSGMEIMRRLIGLAQLPLELNLKERLSLLDEAYELVVNG